MNTCILLRYGEIGLKSKNVRVRWEKLYVKAIEAALKRNGLNEYTIKNYGGRFVVFTEHVGEAAIVLKRVPGILSLSPSLHFTFENKENLLQKVKENATAAKKTFCVRVKRTGKHNFTSQEIEREAGSVLYDESNGVDLHNPQLTVYLEIRNNECFLYTEFLKGLGGLPATSSGKVLCLFSGGIDSPVAALHMLKRGCMVDFLFINLVGPKALADTAQVYNYLISRYTFEHKPRFIEVDGTQIVKKIKEEVEDNTRQLALKIAFYKFGEKFSEEYDALVTGEALSQKSTQTLPSLRLIQSQIDIPVLRPLLSFDKTEIVKIAQHIGTFAKSEKVKEYCNLSDGKVLTAPKEEVLEKIPDFSKGIEKAKVTIYKNIVPVEEEKPIEIEGNVITVDMRPKHLQEHSSLHADKKAPYPFILEELDGFTKDHSYLFVCDFGVQSEEVAYLLRQRGIKAAGVSVKNFLKYFSRS
jgi:tRNA uracil 4-sulfurtransferase